VRRNVLSYDPVFATVKIDVYPLFAMQPCGQTVFGSAAQALQRCRLKSVEATKLGLGAMIGSEDFQSYAFNFRRVVLSLWLHELWRQRQQTQVMAGALLQPMRACPPVVRPVPH
jgi:hypothetical protein